MSEWGKADDKQSRGTVAIATNGNVTGTSTYFTVDAKVGDFMRTDDGQDFFITSITSNTVATVSPARSGDAITTVFAGAEFTLSEKPKFITKGFSNKTTAAEVFGVDVNEMATTNGPAHAGWVKRSTVGDRVRYETLVAMSKNGITGDASDDAQFADSKIVISSESGDFTATANLGYNDLFTVNASVLGAIQSITYKWQESTNGGSTWFDISGTTFKTYATKTLGINAGHLVTGDTGLKFRCVLTASGCATVTSAVKTLTVTA